MLYQQHTRDKSVLSQSIHCSGCLNSKETGLKSKSLKKYDVTQNEAVLHLVRGADPSNFILLRFVRMGDQSGVHQIRSPQIISLQSNHSQSYPFFKLRAEIPLLFQDTSAPAQSPIMPLTRAHSTFQATEWTATGINKV